MNALYFDYAATTPVDPGVVRLMSGCLGQDGVFGNPASRSHGYGWQADAAVETARQQVALFIGADTREIVWTSGATESDNLAIKGAVERCRKQGAHLVTSLSEHKAVIDTFAYLETEGFEVTWLRPGPGGFITADQVRAALRPHTALVSLMLVNNETGVVNQLAGLGDDLRARGILFHVDAAQGPGKIDVNVHDLGVDLLSLSAHKVYGPKGIGALYVRRAPEVSILPQIHGGGHERGMRSGTLPTHQIVGMGEAFRLAGENRETETPRIERLAQRFLGNVLQEEGVSVNGQYRVANIINLSFAGVDGETLLLALSDLAVSSGSACASASMAPSYVLKAMGLTDEQAQSSLRFSLGRFTTEDQVDQAAALIREVLPRLRQRRRDRTARA